MQIPPKIEELIGYSGWTALSWALHNGWVQNYKWLMSERLGRDIGVPETVERMLAPVNGLLKISDEARKEYLLSTGDIMAFNVNMFADKCQNVDGRNFRNLMIEGYLLGTDFVSILGSHEDYKYRDCRKGFMLNGIVPDRDGKDQLEGELRRYVSGRYGIKPVDVELHRRQVFVYCGDNGLREEAYHNFAKKLNLDAGKKEVN